MEKNLACLNGELMPVEEARVPVWDRGFLFGDAVYEVWRLYQGRFWLEDEHVERLRRSLNELSIGPVDLDRLMARARRTIEASGIREGTLYVQVTRGVAPRQHAFPQPPVEPTELIIVRPYEDGPTAQLRETGVRLISRPDQRWKRCDIKTTNLLGNVLAMEAAKQAGGYEAVLVDSEGFVTESTHTSLLWCREGRLEATPDGPEILPGTTRGLMVRLADEIGVAFAEARITLAELIAADEVLLGGTTTEVMPVIRVDDSVVGDGRPGPIARRLQAAYRSAVERWLATAPVEPGRAGGRRHVEHGQPAR